MNQELILLLGLITNDGREIGENHNGTIVQHAIPCAEGRIVEPVNFAHINVPNFTILTSKS